MASRFEARSLRLRILVPLVLLSTSFMTGVLGYHWLWSDQGGTWLDAVFMTVTTLTTIGYGEVKPLDSVGRLLTIGVAISGIGSLFYFFSVSMDYLVFQQVHDLRGR